MKTYSLTRLLAAGLLLLATSACQKVIDLDLREADPRLVIEANLADDGQPCTVRLSRSTRYTEPNTFPPVGGATVTLSDDAGGLETLAATSTPGLYRGASLTGQPGRRYTLRVEADGTAHVAGSTMPTAVPLTGLRAEKSGFGGDNIYLVPEFQDPAGVRNYYLFRQYRNGRLNQSIFLQDDELTDGRANARPLFARNADEADDLRVGDSVRVDMQCVDADVHRYLRTLTQILQGASTATPANPQSNFSGNVLGYFSAHTLRRRSLLVPPL
ncbi:DUF4249 domain-containing protein [Hymenobacter sp. BT175]|uniref:DUF4249 domain-containing protein n=1 Tax=Hymenobacter translucens TaxID=2886507 RepID=UPI001D0DC18E|nr:DUF4249 domain-containing protein [Hymenobacter translucens]MCC2548594.1 DUF4249 domain-containing protein [Hymenobacter translucens]